MQTMGINSSNLSSNTDQHLKRAWQLPASSSRYALPPQHHSAIARQHQQSSAIPAHSNHQQYYHSHAHQNAAYHLSLSSSDSEHQHHHQKQPQPQQQQFSNQDHLTCYQRHHHQEHHPPPSNNSTSSNRTHFSCGAEDRSSMPLIDSSLISNNTTSDAEVSEMRDSDYHARINTALTTPATTTTPSPVNQQLQHQLQWDGRQLQHHHYHQQQQQQQEQQVQSPPPAPPAHQNSRHDLSSTSSFSSKCAVSSLLLLGGGGGVGSHPLHRTTSASATGSTAGVSAGGGGGGEQYSPTTLSNSFASYSGGSQSNHTTNSSTEISLNNSGSHGGGGGAAVQPQQQTRMTHVTRTCSPFLHQQPPQKPLPAPPPLTFLQQQQQQQRWYSHQPPDVGYHSLRMYSSMNKSVKRNGGPPPHSKRAISLQQNHPQLPSQFSCTQASASAITTTLASATTASCTAWTSAGTSSSSAASTADRTRSLPETLQTAATAPILPCLIDKHQEQCCMRHKINAVLQPDLPNPPPIQPHLKPKLVSDSASVPTTTTTNTNTTTVIITNDNTSPSNMTSSHGNGLDGVLASGPGGASSTARASTHVITVKPNSRILPVLHGGVIMSDTHYHMIPERACKLAAADKSSGGPGTSGSGSSTSPRGESPKYSNLPLMLQTMPASYNTETEVDAEAVTKLHSWQCLNIADRRFSSDTSCCECGQRHGECERHAAAGVVRHSSFHHHHQKYPKKTSHSFTHGQQYAVGKPAKTDTRKSGLAPPPFNTLNQHLLVTNADQHSDGCLVHALLDDQSWASEVKQQKSGGRKTKGKSSRKRSPNSARFPINSHHHHHNQKQCQNSDDALIMSQNSLSRRSNSLFQSPAIFSHSLTLTSRRRAKSPHRSLPMKHAESMPSKFKALKSFLYGISHPHQQHQTHPQRLPQQRPCDLANSFVQPKPQSMFSPSRHSPQPPPPPPYSTRTLPMFRSSTTADETDFHGLSLSMEMMENYCRGGGGGREVPVESCNDFSVLSGAPTEYYVHNEVHETAHNPSSLYQSDDMVVNCNVIAAPPVSASTTANLNNERALKNVALTNLDDGSTGNSNVYRQLAMHSNDMASVF